jgi:hypothetical protein
MTNDIRLLRRIPKSVRYTSNWLVTEPRGDPGSMYFNRYSAVTLGPLHYEKQEDYTTLDQAAQAVEDHSHWFDGVALRVRGPWAVLVIQNCLTPAGNVTKGVRQVIKRIGGYWEVTRDGQAIQGILHLSHRQESRGGMIAGYPAFLCREGVCGVTGNGVPGLMGDPMATDQEGFAAVLHEMVTTPSSGGPGKPNEPTTGVEGKPPRGEQQMKLFDEDE